MAVKVNVRIS